LKGRTRRRREPAFTLVELTVVMVLMTLAIGLATLGMRGLSDRGRIDAAAAQLGSAMRLAEIQSARSGVPQVLAFDSHGWTLRQPQWRDDRWAWSESSRLELVRKVAVRRIFMGGVADSAHVDAPWLVTITPGARDTNVVFEVQLASGPGAVIRVHSRGVTEVAMFPGRIGEP